MKDDILITRRRIREGARGATTSVADDKWAHRPVRKYP
jgi:hypothetical protein